MQILCFLIVNLPVLSLTRQTNERGRAAVIDSSLTTLRSNLLATVRRSINSRFGFVKPFEITTGLGIMAIKGFINRFRPAEERFPINNPFVEFNEFAGAFFHYQSENQANFDTVRRASTTVSKRKEVFVLLVFFIVLFFLAYITHKILDRLLVAAEYNSYKKILDSENKGRDMKPVTIKGFNEDL